MELDVVAYGWTTSAHLALLYHVTCMRQGSSFLLHTNPTITKVAPSLVAVSSGAAFAIPASKRGITLLRDRVVSNRSRILAKLGGDGEAKPAGKRKFITREEEPDQYWQTPGERKGENPMMTPLPYIAFANGRVKVPVR